MTHASAADSRFTALDAWRGLCALVVALMHFATTNVLHRNAFVSHGARFVDFFFVLSGFVIAHAYRARLARGGREVRAFLVRRIGRLWPLHVAVLVAFVAIQLAVWAASHAGFAANRGAFARSPLATLPANVLMIHAWGMYRTPTWNPVSWSISTEVFAYGVFAAVCALVRTERRIAVTALAIAVTSAAIVVAFAPDGMKSMADFGLFRCLYGFMTGVLVRLVWERTRPRVGTAGELLVVGAVIAAVTWLPTDDLGVLITPLFGLAVWIFANEDGAVSALLTRAWPQRLGAWSYSIYLIHPLITTVMFVAGRHFVVHEGDRSAIGGPAYVTGAITLVYLVAVIGAARMTYTVIELPGQRLFRSWA